jgi:hypothetical protein
MSTSPADAGLAQRGRSSGGDRWSLAGDADATRIATGAGATSTATVTERNLLAIDHSEIAAEQFVWLVVGAPLNRLSLRGTSHGYPARRLQQIATEAVTTFLSRYAPASRSD